jgi:Uma2 family endonuclease
METVTTLPYGRPLTRADLDAMPDDGHRYELIDGVLLVSPAPSRRHQRAVLRLSHLLARACPPDLEVLVAPFDVVLAEDTVVQPDVVVVRRASDDAAGPRDVALAVEVLSPSTRRVDLLLKRSRLEASAIPAYWVMDPDEPSLTVHQLVDGTYREVARAVRDELAQVSSPFSVTVAPRDLVS